MNNDTPILEARALTKTFATAGGGIDVLRGVDFCVRAGESVSVRGESGSGKTTLLYLLGGLETPTAGEVRWNGESLRGRSQDWLARGRARGVGMIFQSYHLMPELDAFENVLFARRMAGAVRGCDRARAAELLKRVGLADRMRHTPARLSGGECQRVAVARALMNAPRVLLADEPTGNLDERTGEEIMRLLTALTADEGAALVLVTHNAAFAAMTDRALFLRKGVFDTP